MKDSKAPQQPSESFECRIEKMVFGGWGLTHHQGKAVFVSNVAADETVEARIYKKAKGVRYAELNQIVTANANARTDKKCQHAGLCGGCTYQHLSQDYQLKIKLNILAETFHHKAKIGETIVSPRQFNYRNKMEFGFTRPPGGEITYGLHPRGRFRHILDLQECHLINPDLWAIGQTIKQLIRDNFAGDTTGDGGFWQHLTMRQAFHDGSTLIMVEVEDPQSDKVRLLAEKIKQSCPAVVGIAAKKRHGQPSPILGLDYLEEVIGPSKLRFHAENFFQVNVSILPDLLAEIAKLITPLNPKVLYDLFSGVGLFGVALAPHLSKDVSIIAAESDVRAAAIARDNAARNGLTNYQSQAMDLYQKGWGSQLHGKTGPSVAIIDPPRAGLTQKTVDEIGALSPDRIVYVSCNPTTQKRDIDWLERFGYKMGGVRLIDMFPQTYHLESLAWLDKA